MTEPLIGVAEGKVRSTADGVTHTPAKDLMMRQSYCYVVAEGERYFLHRSQIMQDWVKVEDGTRIKFTPLEHRLVSERHKRATKAEIVP